MLRIFKEAGDKNSRNVNYQFWQQDNQPKIIYTPEFAAQKLEYIHNRKRLLLWKEMRADKNRIFDIDLLFASPELQTQDSATFDWRKTKDSWGKRLLIY